MLRRLVNSAVDVRPGELSLALLAATYFFCLMFGYFLLRPLREALGLEGGVDSVRILFLVTLGVMLVVNVLYGWLVARLPRGIFIPLVYRLAILCLGGFMLALWLNDDEVSPTVGRVFYVWLSVFNLFAVTVFWALMADVFTLEQGKRLFGFIGVGGTAGAIVGSAYAWQLAEAIGPFGLMVTAAVLIECGAQLARRVSRLNLEQQSGAPLTAQGARRVGGTAWAGLRDVVRSPYLAGIAGYVGLYTIISTLLYFEKLRIVELAVEESDERTAVFALIELLGQSLTLLIQIFLTGRLMRWLGVGAMLAAVPLVSAIGFVVLTIAPTLTVLAIFEPVRRASNFALSKPARETLFTVIPREDKYKAKSVIDTFVYRGGDTVGTLADKAVALVALGIGALAVPLSVVGVALSLWLGRSVRRRGDRPVQDESDAGPDGDRGQPGEPVGGAA